MQSRQLRNRHVPSAFGRPNGPLVSLIRSPEATTAQTVVERRAADVAVVGGGAAAVLAAYSLAKTGRKVLLLPDYGLSAAQPAARPLQPLKLTDPDSLLVHLAAESAQYWKGLELLSGSTLLTQQQTLDVCCDPERDHLGAAGFSKLQEACAAAAVPTSLLSAAEASAAFRPLQLPHTCAALLQEQGGLIRANDAAAAAQRLAQSVGVQIRDGLLLRGWRDCGSFFQLKASSRVTPELISLFEAEVLLLVPSHWHSSCLGLFSLQLEGMQDVEVLGGHVSAGDESGRLPAAFSWGSFTASDNPLQPQGTAILPYQRGGSPPGLLLQQLPAGGTAIKDPFSWHPASRAWSSRPAGSDEEAQAPGQASSISISSWVDLQVRQLHDTCAQLVRGVAPVTAVSAVHSSLRSTVPDGRPLIGLHPGYEPGRVVLCCGASGSQQFGPGSSCSSSFQLSPMLAKLAADVIRSCGAGTGNGASGAGAVLQGLGLNGRQGLKVGLAEGGEDTWEGLELLQQPRAASKVEQEQQQDEAEDKRQDLRNQELLL